MSALKPNLYFGEQVFCCAPPAGMVGCRSEAVMLATKTQFAVTVQHVNPVDIKRSKALCLPSRKSLSGGCVL